MPPARDPGSVTKKRQTRKPPVAIFGPVGRADAGITRAQRVAQERTQRARRQVERRVVVPYVPKLAHPTSGQRGAAQSIVARGLHREGINTVADVRALPAAQRQRVHRGTGYERTNVKRSDAAAAAARGLSAPTVGELAALGRRLRAQRGDRVGPGVPHKRVGLPFGLAAVDLTNVSRSLASATSLDTGDLGPREFFRHAASDVGALGTSPFIGGYELGVGAVDVARHGDTRRLRQLAKGIGHGIATSVPGELAQGHPGRALESFRQHPVFAALDVAGTAGTAGRLAGGLARAAGSTAESAGARGVLARFGSTVRAPIGLNADGGLAIAERTFSKDSLRKGAQVAADKAREPLTDAEGRVVTVMQRGRRVPVLKAHPGEHGQLHARRVDFTASRANATERLSREVAVHDVASATRGGVRGRLSKPARAIVSMAVEKTIRPAHFAEDVTKRIGLLEEKLKDPAANYRHSGDVKAAREEVAALRKARDLTGEQQARVFAAADRVAKVRRAQDAEEIRLGTLDRAQAERAALGPYAMSHMGARHVTVEEHAALERSARQVEAGARAKVDALPKGPERARALAEWRRARDHRIEVSGRHPGEVRLHENAQAQAKRAGAAHDRAKAEISKLERSRQRVIGAQTVRRGAKTGTEVRGKRALETIDRKLGVAREKERAARQAARETRQAAATSRLPEAQAALRTAEGKHLPNEAIHEHMRASGLEPDQVAQLSHKPLGNAAYHKRFDVSTRPGQPAQRRTGAAFERGTSGFGERQIEDTAAHASTRIAKAQQIDRFIHDNALKHPAAAKAARGEQLTKHEQKVVDRGGAFTPKEAVELADRLKNDTGREYVAIRMFGARVSKETQAEIRGMQSPRAFEGLTGKLLNDRVVTAEDIRDKGARNVALVPAEDVNRLARHLAPAGEIEAALQMLNRPFRFSVLAQPRWLTGNFVEPFLVRLPSVGSGLVNIPGLAVDIAASRKIVRSMERSGDPAVRAAAKEIKAQQHGGLFLGGRGASNRRRAADSSSPVMQRAGVVRDLPVVKQLGDLLAVPPSLYFRANRQLIERWAQEAAFGHQARADIREITGSWAKTVTLGRKAIEDVQAGLVNTATQERFMRAQHELLGKYEGFGPRTRRLIQTVAPFLPWAMSAARFVFWTMPAHHTVLTDLLLKTEATVDQSWQEAHKPGVVPPGTLRLAIPTKKGGFTDIARYGPYGFTAPIVQGDLQGVTDEFMPQVSGAVAAVQGKDPFGRDLRVQPTKSNPQGIPSGWDKFLIALNSIGEATAGPYPALARRIEEHGETPYGNSFLVSPKTKPGTSHGMSGVRRALDPFRPTYLRSGSSGSSGTLAPAGEAQQILAGARGHVTVRPDVSEAQRILQGSRR